MFRLRYRTAALEQPRRERAPESPWLDAGFVESYAYWRDASSAVRSSYDHWSSAEPRDRMLAWSAYRAALDREERAANAYQACAQRISEQ